MVALIHGLRKYLELHQHSRVADVPSICLLNYCMSPHQEMLQPLLLLRAHMARAEFVYGEGDESAEEFARNRSYGSFHRQRTKLVCMENWRMNGEPDSCKWIVLELWKPDIQLLVQFVLHHNHCYMISDCSKISLCVADS